MRDIFYLSCILLYLMIDFFSSADTHHTHTPYTYISQIEREAIRSLILVEHNWHWGYGTTLQNLRNIDHGRLEFSGGNSFLKQDV